MCDEKNNLHKKDHLCNTVYWQAKGCTSYPPEYTWQQVLPKACPKDTPCFNAEIDSWQRKTEATE